MLCAVLPFYPFEPANKALQAHPYTIVFGALATIAALFLAVQSHPSRRIALGLASAWLGVGVALLLANVVIAGGITIILGLCYTLDYLIPTTTRLIPSLPVDKPGEPCEVTVDKSGTQLSGASNLPT